MHPRPNVVDSSAWLAYLANEPTAGDFAGAIERTTLLDGALALSAARVGLAHELPLADSIVDATARAVGGVVWTQDDDFATLPDVEYRPKQMRRQRAFAPAPPNEAL